MVIFRNSGGGIAPVVLVGAIAPALPFGGLYGAGSMVSTPPPPRICRHSPGVRATDSCR